MPLFSGQRLSHYEILGPLGAGAMGEVYRARDARLEREVALKVLPEELAGDEERLRRFEREAKALASMSHPNVAQVYGLDQVGDTWFISMELVPGEDLAARLSSGALPLDEALDICSQIAEGLEVAHEAGVIHRDLKPANVIVTPEGRVKVLDFGLAKATGPDAGEGSTVDSAMATAQGRLLGTPTYMAPEQARARPIDRRVDVWAFGCVLYECLTGERAFAGRTIPDVLVAVLHREADLDRLPAATPARVRELVARCLVKDPHMRLRDLGDARLELARAEEPIGGAAPASGVRSRTVIAAFAAGALLIAGLAGLLYPAGEPQVDRVRRFSLHNLGMPLDAFQGLALSPDGSRLVFRAFGEDRVDRLHLRSMDSFEVQVLEGTESAWLPFFSPDGESLGFFAGGALTTISLAGGLARSVTPLPGGFSGAAWLPDGSIIVSHVAKSYLSRVSASGGSLERLELGDPEVELVTSPSGLPGGEAILCSVRRGGRFEVAVLSLRDGTLRVIAKDGFTPTYAASGHVLFQEDAAGRLMALPFDLGTLSAAGAAFPVLSDIGARISYQVRMYAIAADGTLAYIPDSVSQESGALVWVDRRGQASPIVEISRVIFGPRLSHDGRRIAFRTPAPDCDLWVHDLERGSTGRLTREGDNHGSVWSTDDRRVLFNRKESSGWSLLSAAADGSGEVQQLARAEIPNAFASSCTPDGEHVLVGTRRDDTGGDVYLATVSEQSITPLLASRFQELAGVFSPDGLHIAYVSDESGQPEVYVQPFPALDRRVQVSTGGGAEPAWAPTGDTLFYRTHGAMMAVPVVTAPTFSAGRPEPLFEDVYAGRGATGLADYDVSADGERFVMIRQRAQEGGAEVHVVLDWFAELRDEDPRQSR